MDKEKKQFIGLIVVMIILYSVGWLSGMDSANEKRQDEINRLTYSNYLSSSSVDHFCQVILADHFNQDENTLFSGNDFQLIRQEYLTHCYNKNTSVELTEDYWYNSGEGRGYIE